MKIFNLKNVIAVLALVAFLAACSSNNNPVTPGGGLAAPTGLSAISKDAGTVTLKWTASTDESNSAFDHYVITVSPGVITPKTVTKGQTTVDIGSLQEGTVYTFTIKSVNTSGTEGTGATINWSPAARYNQANNQTIKMYERASNLGSGLQITDQGTVNLNKDSKTLWNFGVDTQSGLLFGSASQISIGSGTPTQITQLSHDFDEANSLDELGNSASLATAYGTFSEVAYDLSQAPGNSGLVYAFRISKDGGNTWNYGRVLIKRTNGTFLQGPSGNQYIEVEVSYQHTAGVPYAKHSF